MKSHCLATGLGQSICGAAVTCPGQSPHTAGVCAVVVAVVGQGIGKLPRHYGEIGKQRVSLHLALMDWQLAWTDFRHHFSLTKHTGMKYMYSNTLFKYSFEVLVHQYFHFILLYNSTALHFTGKFLFLSMLLNIIRTCHAGVTYPKVIVLTFFDSLCDMG